MATQELWRWWVWVPARLCDAGQGWGTGRAWEPLGTATVGSGHQAIGPGHFSLGGTESPVLVQAARW